MLIISMFCFSIQGTLGDPTREMAAMSMSDEERVSLRESLGLNDPLPVQYGRFVKRALQGDLGTSYFFKEPALDVILKKLPATLELSFAASLIIIFVSIPLGVFCAIQPRHWFSRFTMAISVVGISIPVFLTALALIFIFSITLGWMPSFGRGEIVQVWGYWSTNFASWDGIVHIIMPAIALSSIMLPLFIRLVRHALKNTMLPVITVGGVQIGIMVAYTILTESVFQWPGMGFMFLEAVNRSDIPLITAYIMFVGFLFVVVNTLVDLLYGVINPMVDLVGRRQ
jgi:peptide/nickel transport system permease protein